MAYAPLSVGWAVPTEPPAIVVGTAHPTKIHSLGACLLLCPRSGADFQPAGASAGEFKTGRLETCPTEVLRDGVGGETKDALDSRFGERVIIHRLLHHAIGG